MIRTAILSLTLAASLVTAAPAKDLTPEEMATRFVAISTFVQNHCPTMKTDPHMFVGVLAKLGIDAKSFANKTNRMVQAEVIMETFKQDVPGSCRYAWKMFGDNGDTLPGLLTR